MYSDTISAFHPAPQAVMLPVRSEGTIAGSSTRRQGDRVRESESNERRGRRAGQFGGGRRKGAQEQSRQTDQTGDHHQDQDREEQGEIQVSNVPDDSTMRREAAVQAHGCPAVLGDDRLYRRHECVSQARKPWKPAESFVRRGYPRDLVPRRLHPEPLRPDAEGTPDESVEGQDDRGEDADPEGDAGTVARNARVRDERAESGSGKRAPERGEGLARDQEEP